MAVINFFIFLFYIYVGLGVVIGIFLAFRGVNKFDPNMQNARWPLRLLILPGTIGLWPLLLIKYFSKHK